MTDGRNTGGRNSNLRDAERFHRSDHTRRQAIIDIAQKARGSARRKLEAVRSAIDRGDLTPGPLPEPQTLHLWLKKSRGGVKDMSKEQKVLDPVTAELRDSLKSAWQHMNDLASQLMGAELFAEHTIQHRNLLKQAKNARNSGDHERMRRIRSKIQRRCSKYKGLIAAGIGTEAAPSPELRKHLVGKTAEQVKSEPAMTRPEPAALAENALLAATEPAYGQVVGWATLSKPERDARIRAILVLPYLNGSMTAEECAANWRARLDPLDTPENAMFDLVWLPEDGLEQFRTVTARTIRRWAEKIRQAEGRASKSEKTRSSMHEILVNRKPSSWKDGRVRVTPEIRTLAKDLFLTNQNWSAGNVADVLRHVHSIDLSRRTVERIIAAIPDHERALARGGPAAADVLLRERLLRDTPYPNHTWLIDHSFLSQEIASEDPAACKDFDLAMSALEVTWNSAGQKVLQRVDGLHMTVVQDACTRHNLSVRLWPRTPTTRETLVAIWEAAVLNGLPERLYSDNGSDFRSGEVGATLSAAGIVHIFSLPYTPQGRGKIERLFRTIKERVMVHLTGYHGGAHPVRYEDDELLPLGEVERHVRGGIELLINGETHSRTGRIPSEHFSEEVGVRGIPPEPERLIRLLMAHDDVTKKEHGVRFRNRYYWSERLAGYIHGTRLRVHYDPYRRDVIHLSVRGQAGAYIYIGPARSYLGGDPTPGAHSVRAAEEAWLENVGSVRAEHDAVVKHRRRQRQAKTEGEHLADEATKQIVGEGGAQILHPPKRLPPPERPTDKVTGDEAKTPNKGNLIVNPFFD